MHRFQSGNTTSAGPSVDATKAVRELIADWGRVDSLQARNAGVISRVKSSEELLECRLTAGPDWEDETKALQSWAENGREFMERRS